LGDTNGKLFTAKLYTGTIGQPDFSVVAASSDFVFNNGNICIVLTWNQTPEDLDAHIKGFLEFYDEQFHVFYGNTSDGGASLDIDDTDGYGPETITISQLSPNITYRYWVHDFTNGCNTYSTALADSGAKVQVYINGQNNPITYNVPSMEGTNWHSKLSVYGSNANFADGITTLAILDGSSNDVAPNGTTLDIIGSTIAVINLASGLGPGSYRVKLITQLANGTENIGRSLLIN